MTRELGAEPGGRRAAPVELVAVLVGIHGLPVRHIKADHPDAGDRRRDHPFLHIVEGGQCGRAIGRLTHLFADEERDAVVRPLARAMSGIAGLRELTVRELRILDLRFLQAHDVRALGGQPVEEPRQADRKRVDVPGGDFHEVSMLFAARPRPLHCPKQACADLSASLRRLATLSPRSARALLAGSRPRPPRCLEQACADLSASLRRLATLAPRSAGALLAGSRPRPPRCLEHACADLARCVDSARPLRGALLAGSRPRPPRCLEHVPICRPRCVDSPRSHPAPRGPCSQARAATASGSRRGQ